MYYLLVCGFVSILSQVLILRELYVAFFGIELIYILSIGIWLLWTATGSWLGKKSYIPSEKVISYIFLIFSIILPLEVMAIRSIRIIFGASQGTYLSFDRQLLSLTTAIMPIGILVGILFQWTTKSYINYNKSLPKAYAIESIGGLLGGLASTFLLVFNIQNFTSSIICSSLCLLSFIKKSKYITIIGILFFYYYIFSLNLDQSFTRLTHPNLIKSFDSAYGRITVEKNSNQWIIFENDNLSFESEGITNEIYAHLALLSHISPKKIFIAGGFANSIWLEILKHNPYQIELAEIDSLLIDNLKQMIPSRYNLPENKILNICKNDPRRFILQENTYDLILINSSDPDSGLSNRLYTKEYFKICKERLASNGILSLRLKSSENIWTSFLIYRNTSIYLALKDVFKNVLILPIFNDILILASNSLIEDNPEKLITRFNDRKLQNRFVAPQYINYVYSNDRRFEIEKKISSAKIKMNTDIEPVCYRYTSLMWLSKFIPKNKLDSLNLIKKYSYLYLLPIFILFLFLIKKPKIKYLLAVGIFSGIGTTIETVLMLYYQIKFGVLYKNIGLLLMMFMSGLSFGAWLIDFIYKNYTNKKYIGIGLIALFTVFSFFLSFIFYKNIALNIFIVSISIFLAAFFTSGIFAYISLSVKELESMVSSLYAVDLLGGCIASLLVGLIFIPYLGFTTTALFGSFLCLFTLLLVK